MSQFLCSVPGTKVTPEFRGFFFVSTFYDTLKSILNKIIKILMTLNLPSVTDWTSGDFDRWYFLEVN